MGSLSVWPSWSSDREVSGSLEMYQIIDLKELLSRIGVPDWP
jgi:hypothetical protein